MLGRRGDEPETYHLTCPVCGALPGTSCIEDFQELERVHPSRRMSVAERNRRHAVTGWEPPELAERRPGKPDPETARALQPAAASPECGRPQAAAPRPRREPGNVTGPARAGGNSPGGDSAARAVAAFPQWAAERDSLIWFAAYLSAFPRGAAVPREQLRGIASAGWGARTTTRSG
jgi:hypothetical protein